ncbi:head-tail connector protein [Metabacillus litoralis]|uniref:head-tail connector protein n=1 Tax=Metabacillus litoralis TaxID=152268 RepID=UPI00203EB4DE|nr:head-tail connector protein [Metabacillus litoralis]MCM3411233.1 head-tail connector protein [Metabacillus litoralis]
MLEDIKTVLRIDGTEDDYWLSSLISSAKTEIQGSTGVIVDESNDFHKNVVSLIVMKYHDTEMAEKLNPIIDRMLVHLQYQVTTTEEGTI